VIFYLGYARLKVDDSQKIGIIAAMRKTKYIFTELRNHAPFTAFGTLLGIVFMLIFNELRGQTSKILFDIFHPAHVVLSAMTTTAVFRLHSKKAGFGVVLVIGFVGSIGIATLSDCLIPYAGELLLDLRVSHSHVEAAGDGDHGHKAASEAENHGLEAAGDGDHVHKADGKTFEPGGAHIGFIDSWYIVNPAAILGVLIAYILRGSKFPHAGHVLLSIWASLFHILMAMGDSVSFAQWLGISVFLFVAVWLPCCFSDIVFPLLFIKLPDELPSHSH